MGSRSWLAVVLFAAAGAACSKPNPAFVDSDPSVTAGETTTSETTTTSGTTSETTSETTEDASTTEAAWMPACVEPDYCPPFLNVASLLPPEISAQCVGETHFYVRRLGLPLEAEVFLEDNPCTGDPSVVVPIDFVVGGVLSPGLCFEIFHEGYDRGGTCRTRAVVVFNEGSDVTVDPPKLAAVVTSFDPPQQLAEDLRLRRSRSSMCECVDLCSEPAIGSPLEWCCGGMSEQFGLEFSSMGKSAMAEMAADPLPIFDYRGALFDLYMTRAHVPCGQPMMEDVSWAMIRK
jgi:hypothetical protein